MPTGIINKTINVAGISVSAVIQRTGEGSIGQDPVTLPAGQAGTLSTRTDNDTGVVTVAEGHGITDADTVDVYFDDGVRYGMSVTAYDSTTITVDGGAGDNLPAEDDTVIVGVRTEVNMDVDGDDIQMIVAVCDQRAHLVFQDSGPLTLAAVEIPTANEPWEWAADTAIANPLTGNAVDAVQVSNGSTTEATLRIALIYDSVV